MIKQYLVFFQEFLQEFENTGSFVPTSRLASRVLTSPVETLRSQIQDRGLRVLEVGAGTGPITRVLASRLQPGDELHICEINPRLMNTLRQNLGESKDFKKLGDSIHYHECPVQEVQCSSKFDFVVCSLPFLNFPIELTTEVFETIRGMTEEHSHLTFFEYLGIRAMRKALMMGRNENPMRTLESFYQSWFGNYDFKSQAVWSNIPPMLVHFQGGVKGN